MGLKSIQRDKVLFFEEEKTIGSGFKVVDEAKGENVEFLGKLVADESSPFRHIGEGDCVVKDWSCDTDDGY